MKMMDSEARLKLKALLIKHEGYRTHLYQDTVGKWTIGIGYNISDRGLPDDWIISQYERDVAYFYSQLYADYIWFRDLIPARQIVLIDMAFMGYKKLQEFKHMLTALSHRDYARAADEMLNSKWAVQVSSRADELAAIMRSGELS
jgi:lysozyme